MSEHFEELVAKYHKLVIHLIHKYYGGRMSHEAEDLSQEVWAKLWVHLKKNESQVVNFKSYLYRTVQTTLWDAVRKVDQEPVSLIEEQGADVTKARETFEADEKRILERKQLDVLIQQLKIEEQHIVRAYIQGLNYAEIALLTGTTEGRIRNLLTRLKKKLARSYHAFESRRL
jgi:RNA polymerase sigma factor (sigma-70 family)